MKKKVLITAGGTGGHIYPAVGLATQMTECDILFAGGKLKTNRFFANSGFPCEEVHCATIKMSKPWLVPQSLWTIGKGVWESLKILQKFNPDVVVGFGSFYTLPILLAAKLKGIPIVLHEQNRPLGKVNKLLSPYVSAIGVHFPDTKAKKAVEVVGMPLRERYHKDSLTKAEAIARYGLDPLRFTLLIFGGSQGAQKLNETLIKAAPLLKKQLADFQILHFIGGNTAIDKSFYQQTGISAYVAPFEEKMEYAWQAADLVICRSGAGTVAEQIEFEVPGILVPYPLATDQHQDKNADFVVEKVGLAFKIQEKDLSPEELTKAIVKLKTSPEFKQNVKNYKKHRVHKDLKTLVMCVMKERS